MSASDAPEGLAEMWFTGSVLRQFSIEDQMEVRALILAGLAERWGTAFDEAFNSDIDDIASTYVDNGAHVVVVERDGEIVATGMLVPDGEASGTLVRMSVSSSHRRQGLGRQVVDALVAYAKLNGFTEVLVATDTPWLSAVALYESCGFTETGCDETDTYFAMVFHCPAR